MKFLYELRMFYKKESFSAIILLLVTFTSQFFLTYFLGTYRYCIFQTEYFKSHFNSNATLCMTYNSENLERMSEIKEKLYGIEGVSAIVSTEAFYTSAGTEVEIELYTKEMWQYAPVKYSDTFYTCENNDDGLPECILMGQAYNSYIVGDTIELPLAKGSLKCIVSETIRRDAYITNLQRSSTKISAYDLYNQVDTVLIKESEQVNMLLKDSSCMNFILICNKNIATDKRTEIENIIKEYSYIFVPYDEILKNTEDAAELMLQEKLPAPLFFTIISKFSCFCISLVFIMRKMKALTIKRLIGCSRRQSIYTTILYIAFPGLISLILNLTIWLCYPSLVQHNILSFGSFRLDLNVYISLILDYMITSSVVVLAVFADYARKSLVELLKIFEKK